MDTWIAQYEAHAAKVIRTIPAKQLLVLDVSEDGAMTKLCVFLQETSGPCGDPHTPFPHTNTRDDHIARLKNKQLARSLFTVENAGSQYAYVTTLSLPKQASLRQGEDNPAAVRSLFSSVKTLRQHGAKADVVVLVDGGVKEKLMQAMTNKGINVVPLRGLGKVRSGDSNDSYRTRIWALGLLQYTRVLFFDSKIEFLSNPDELFETDNVFTGFSGPGTPLNGDVWVAAPDWQAVVDVGEVSRKAGEIFSSERGWLEYGGIAWGEEGESHGDWTFPRANADSGLLYYYYFGLNGGLRAKLEPASALDQYVRVK